MSGQQMSEEQARHCLAELFFLRRRNRELEEQVKELAWQCRNGGAVRLEPGAYSNVDGKVTRMSQ